VPLPRVHELLDLYRSPAKGAPEKLQAALAPTWEDPRGFLLEVFRHASLRTARPPRSVAFELYDLYHDAVLRHTGEARIALAWLDREMEWREMTFGELHARATRLAELWVEAGALAGETVAVIEEPGPDRHAALFAALLLGMVPSLHAPECETLLAARLKAAKPDRVSVAPHHEWRAAGFEKAVLPRSDEARAEPAEASFAYPAGAPALRLFSPLAKDPMKPIEVTADAALLGALRDAALVFGVGPGDAMAAPGVDDLQHQPALLLSAALSGATWVELSLEDVEDDPRRLSARPLASLGVSRALREVLLAKPIDLGEKVGHIWTPLDESLEPARIEEMRRALGLEKVPATSAHIDAALGGAILASSARWPARFDATHATALPMAGLAHEVRDASGAGGEAPSGVGVFAAAPPGSAEAVATTRVVVKAPGDWFDAGHMEPRRFGRTYLDREVEAALHDLPFIVHASVHPVPAPGAPNPFSFTLSLFTGPLPAAQVEAEALRWKDLAAEAVRLRLGPAHVPDRIDVYPYFARRGQKGALDHDWVRRERAAGGLNRRAKSAPQRLLAELMSAAVYGRLDAAALADADGGQR